MADRVRTIRHRAYEILERDRPNDRVASWVAWGLMAMVAINVTATVLYTDPRFVSLFPGDFVLVGALSLIVFSVEYGFRLWSSVEARWLQDMPGWRARLRWMATPTALIDLAALVPFVLLPLVAHDLRTLAILRMLRFLKFARYSPGIASLAEAAWRERYGLGACVVVLCGAVLLAATAMYAVEGDVQPDKLGSIPLAMWWAVTTLTTVGYGDVVPVTLGGRIIGGFTMIAGIFTLALPVGIFATAFVEVIHRRNFVVTWGMVARIPLFADLEARALAEVMPRLAARSVGPGELVVAPGHTAHSVFFIVQGEIEIQAAGHARNLGAGDYFGEVGPGGPKAREALIRARAPTRLLVLGADDIEELGKLDPRFAERLSRVSLYDAED